MVTIPIDWPNVTDFRRYFGKCPKRACPRNFGATTFEPQFFPPVNVKRRLSDQLIQLVDGRVLHIENCHLIW